MADRPAFGPRPPGTGPHQAGPEEILRVLAEARAVAERVVAAEKARANLRQRFARFQPGHHLPPG